MPDILLIQPPIRDFYLTAKRTIPCGLAALAAPLIRAGYTVEILDMMATGKRRPIDLPGEMAYLKDYYTRSDISPFGLFHQFHHFGYSYEYLHRELKRQTPFLIGVSSLFTAYSDEALHCAEIARKIHPDAVIVMGGHHPTALPAQVMAHDFVDYCLRGEGETSLLPLVQALEKGRDMSTVPGIVYRKKNGEIHIASPSLMADPGAYPLPASHLIKTAYYSRRKGTAISLMTGRGCPMMCAYCSMGTLFKRYRKRSVSHVMTELNREVATRGATFIDFEDENLSLDKRWFTDLLKQIIAQFGTDTLELRAMNGLFPPSLDEDLILLMKEAGFRTLNLSLGTTDPDQLKRFRRPDVRDATDHVLHLAEKHGLESVCYVIAGAPGQTAASSLEDLLYLGEKPTLAGVSVYYPAPGSHDYTELEQRGALPPSFSLMRSTAIPMNTPTTRLESVTLLRLSRIINFIKQLKKNRETLPEPRPFTRPAAFHTMDRTEIGRNILSWFLYDGQIRGMTKEGEIYAHQASSSLTRRFIHRL